MEANIQNNAASGKKKKNVSYAKWGYIFLIPFFAVYLVFTFYPQLKTFWYSFTTYRQSGLNIIGPKFCGIQNYETLFDGFFSGKCLLLKALGNTMLMWIIGAVPQLLCSLLLAILFTSTRLNLKCTGFFKSVFYAPNLIMATAFALLFSAIFSGVGPAQQILEKLGWADSSFRFLDHTWSTQGLVALMNYLMWFGNTTILLMAGIMGIDESIFESARVDGASSFQVFRDITMPLLKPIMVYVLITSMIGGIQMYDVPQVLTGGVGGPNNTTKTLIMYLNDYLSVHNYGMAGAISVILFIVTGVLSILVFRSITKKDN